MTPRTSVFRALRTLSRSDRKRLLLASASPSFRSAVELLFALDKLSYSDETLTCRGQLPAAAVRELIPLGQTQRYQDAIRELADEQQQILTRKLGYCTLPLYEIDLGPTTFDLAGQPHLADYVYYDSARKKLIVRGQLTDAERTAIERGAAPPLPQAALQALPMRRTPARRRSIARSCAISFRRAPRSTSCSIRESTRTCRRQRPRSPRACSRR